MYRVDQKTGPILKVVTLVYGDVANVLLTKLFCSVNARRLEGLDLFIRQPRMISFRFDNHLLSKSFSATLGL